MTTRLKELLLNEIQQNLKQKLGCKKLYQRWSQMESSLIIWGKGYKLGQNLKIKKC